MSSSEDIRVCIEELEKQSVKIRKESAEMTKRIEKLKDEIANRDVAKKSKPGWPVANAALGRYPHSTSQDDASRSNLDRSFFANGGRDRV